MPEGVAPSKLGAQPVGEVALVAEGVYQLKLPVPFPLRFVSVYLLEGEDGWTLMDSGYDYPPTYEAWWRGAREVGCDLERDVGSILVTHSHPDHLGGARWLQERSGAPVYMLEAEIPFSRRLWGDPAVRRRLADYLVQNGMPSEMADSAAAEVRSGLQLPEDMLPLRSGERVLLGRVAARIIHTPGHADNQFVLNGEERGILFAADQLMLGVTPSVGLWPESGPHPMARYKESLAGLRGLGASLVLPGHGPIFHDLEGRIAELLDHHERRLDLIAGAIEGRPKTPYAVSRVAFRGAITVRQRCFALAETLAYLDHLVLEGRAELVEGEPVAYRTR